MEEKDLIRKLEQTSLPDVELTGHRAALRRVLLEKYPLERGWGRGGTWFPLFWGPRLAGGVILAALLVATAYFQFFYPVAQAEDIARSDQRVKALLDQGASIKQKKVVGHKGYFLIKLTSAAAPVAPSSPAPMAASPLLTSSSGLPFAPTSGQPSSPSPIPSLLPSETPENQVFVSRGQEPKKTATSFLVEVDLQSRAVAALENISLPPLALDSSDEQNAQKISQESQMVKKAIPPDARVKEVQAASPDFNLVEKHGRVKAQPLKQALIIYRQDGRAWQALIDLDSAQVEKVETLESIVP